jgi:hypothetical protein
VFRFRHAFLSCAFLLAACGGSDAPIVGAWATNHGGNVLEFHSNGICRIEGDNDCTWSARANDGYIMELDEGGQVTRAVVRLDGDNMTVILGDGGELHLHRVR